MRSSRLICTVNINVMIIAMVMKSALRNMLIPGQLRSLYFDL